MRAKRLFTVFLTVFLSFSMMGCETVRNVQDEDKTDESVTKNQNMDNPDISVSVSQSVTYEGEEVYIKDGQEVGLNAEIEQDGCIWMVSFIEITKELGNRSQTDFNYWGESIDALGNLTENQSYLFVTVSCRNSSGSVKEVLLNSNGFVAVDKAGQLFETGSEARYISKKQDGNGSLEKVFHYILEDGEETGLIEIGYIIEDSVVNDYNNLYYCVGMQGSQLGNPENRYIKVDTVPRQTHEKS